MVAEPDDWQFRCKELKHRGAYLWQSGQWSDYTFKVGCEPHKVLVPVHKLILAMASPVFEAMFYSNKVDAEKEDPIPILDIQPEVFNGLLEYIYTDNINIGSIESACDIYFAAETYKLPYLMKKCYRYLWSSLSPNNVCLIYQFAKKVQPQWLLKKCIQIIQSKTKEVLEGSSFEKAELSTVKEVFSMEYLDIDNELQLFEAVERRVRAVPEDLEDLRSLVPLLRLLTLTAPQFADGPARSALLTLPESFAVLVNIVSRNPVPMPAGFCASRESRGRALPSSNVLDKISDSCWRLILDYVPVKDIIRSERVSRQWQKMVLSYLSGIRIGVQHDDFYSLSTARNVHWVTLDRGYLHQWTKHRALLVAACCHTDRDLRALCLCPRLEAVTFINLPDRVLTSQVEAFKRLKLKQICFSNCSVSDDCVADFVTNDSLKKLEIRSNPLITGQCLTRSQLQSLTIDNCKLFQFRQLEITDFKQLIELEINSVPQEVYTKLHSVLPCMPNLKVLVTFDNLRCDKFFEAVSRLSQLECLYSCFEARDEDLEAVARNCKNLRVLNLGNCFDVSGRGVESACLHAARLSAFGVVGSEYVTDDDVVAVIHSCPNLKWLDVCYCVKLTPSLLKRAAAARRGNSRCPLQLFVTGTSCANRGSRLANEPPRKTEKRILHTAKSEYEELTIIGDSCFLPDQISLKF